ncbi:MAG: radical SAM protein, partial [bacterium]|nr:radical SAM protein [bacterium]
QSGSNRILRLMNRGYTIEKYFEIVEKIKEVRPDALFSTDIIVGFPTETDEDFIMTIEALKRLKPVMTYVFKYSARPYTTASNMKQLNPDIISKRHSIALGLAKSFSC